MQEGGSIHGRIERRDAQVELCVCVCVCVCIY